MFTSLDVEYCDWSKYSTRENWLQPIAGQRLWKGRGLISPTGKLHVSRKVISVSYKQLLLSVCTYIHIQVSLVCQNYYNKITSIFFVLRYFTLLCHTQKKWHELKIVQVFFFLQQQSSLRREDTDDLLQVTKIMTIKRGKICKPKTQLSQSTFSENKNNALYDGKKKKKNTLITINLHVQQQGTEHVTQHCIWGWNSEQNQIQTKLPWDLGRRRWRVIGLKTKTKMALLLYKTKRN